MNQRKETIKYQKPGYRWLLVIFILFCELMVHIWIRTESTQAIIQISNAQEKLTKAQSYTKALSLERDRLKSDARITGIAKIRLGLSENIFDRIVYLDGGDR
ncbi:hypothetical protein [Desulfospira joergensenii]|uniref:hypothetical protein n=1 Tax=Desulfospira joergensenii TaxID=53329 RepID=UPI0003B78653|nr:hypothetical protein [Desulfospira joergensenii]